MIEKLVRRFLCLGSIPHDILVGWWGWGHVPSLMGFCPATITLGMDQSTNTSQGQWHFHKVCHLGLSRSSSSRLRLWSFSWCRGRGRSRDWRAGGTKRIPQSSGLFHAQLPLLALLAQGRCSCWGRRLLACTGRLLQHKIGPIKFRVAP